MKVMLSGNASSKKYENMVASLGGQLVKTIKEHFDVLVISSVTRSIKFLQACNIGAKIVS